MSRKYQGLIILNTKAHEGSVDELVSSISKEIETEGAKLQKITQIGRRQFAYSSRHLEAGHYVNYEFESAPETIQRIRQRLHLNEQVHLQHYQRVS
jgi:small subunit ribosomal protein S6